MKHYKFINEPTIKQLINDIGEESMFEILTSFVNEAQIHLKQIKKSAAESAMQDLQSSAHALKGSAGMVGALQLQNELLQLEEACHNDERLAIQYTADIELTVIQTVAEIQKLTAVYEKV